MPERHAKLLEIYLGQLRQDIGVDFTRAKERLISLEAQAAQPRRYIHQARPSSWSSASAPFRSGVPKPSVNRP